MSTGSFSSGRRILSTRSWARLLYSSIMPRTLTTDSALGAAAAPSHILAFTSPERSARVMSRYLPPLEEVRCSAALTSRKPSNICPRSMAASWG